MTYIFLSIIALLYVFAAFRIHRTGMRTKRKAVLLSTRLAASIIVACIVLEPTFTVTRFVPSKTAVAVLVDVSASMRSFDADSSINALLPTVRRLKESGITVSFWGFGDSIRALPSLPPRAFNDRSSIFGSALPPPVQKAGTVLLVTDGNFSYSSPLRASFAHKEIWYCPLTLRTRPQFCTVEFPDGALQAIGGKRRTISVIVRGYQHAKNPVLVRCSNDTAAVFSKKIDADSGFFSLPLSIPVSSGFQGTHVYKLTAALQDRAETAYGYCTLKRDCDTVFYRMYSPSPSLDKRFLRLKLNEDNRFVEMQETPPGSTPLLLIFFAFDDGAAQLLHDNPLSAVLFMGTLPSRPYPLPVNESWRVHATDAGAFVFGIGHTDFPPLHTVVTCPHPPFEIQSVFLGMDTLSDPATDAMIPVLFTFLHKQRLMTAVAATGVWRWDFRQQLETSGTSSQTFLSLLSDYCFKLAEAQLNRDFFAYPGLSTVSDIDSLAFAVQLPATLEMHERSTVVCTLFTQKGTPAAIRSRDAYSFHRQDMRINLPPVAPGTYYYTFTLETKSRKHRYSDSITVTTGISEKDITSQNRNLLEEFGAALNVYDTAATFGALSGKRELGSHETAALSVTVRRTWYLLAMCIMLLGMEWLIRRLWHLE